MGATESIAAAVSAARAEGRRNLLETESSGLVAALGIRAPAVRVIGDAREISAKTLDSLPGDRVVVKVVSPEIAHKSDVGGVAVAEKTPEAVREAVERMADRLKGHDVRGYSINEFIVHDASPGGELLLGMRWTPDFGPVVTVGPGGVHAEPLSKSLAPDRRIAIFAPGLATDSGIAAALDEKIVTSLATGRHRGRNPRLAPETLRLLVTRLLQFASESCPSPVAEFEINPLVLTDHGPVALDSLLTLGETGGTTPLDKPLWKLARLLEPRSIGIVGVSEKLNPGHIIIDNILAQGLERERIHVVKPGADRVLGCAAVPNIASLPDPVDLLILSVGAEQVPGLIEEAVQSGKAETILVIPGGLGERSGTDTLSDAVQATLARVRAEGAEGPLVNGGNCLGIRSVPGRYNTLFLPESRLPMPRTATSPLALISQSGALIAAKTSTLHGLNPKYLISIGNQIDLTTGDYLTYLEQDAELEVFACYVEGFRPLDGKRWLEAADRITASGRTVILYRAGRTPEGARATVSHTASIAGDYEVTRELARQAGVLPAESLADFEDLIRLACLLEGKPVRGLRLGAVSNAGFECVSFGDNLGPFALAALGVRTTEALGTLLERCRLDGIVGAQNPLDVTPIMGDAAFEEAVRIVLADDEVDVGIVGCVPMTSALRTVAGEIETDDSIAVRLAGLYRDGSKPWITVVDGGPLYDPLALALARRGVPVFRTSDRALRLLGTYCESRLRRGGASRTGPTVTVP